MSYDEWLEAIDVLLKRNDEEIKNKMLSENENHNINYMLEPKLIDLIKFKFNKCVSDIKASLEVIMEDNYVLDMTLSDFKKKVKFVFELIDIKNIREEKRNELYDTLKEGTEEVYRILLREASSVDSTGAYELTIKNNRIKWSDQNEL